MPKAPTTAKTSTPPNTLTGLAGWVEVFKAGNHIDATGKACTFSHADLDQIVVNHKLGAAPAVIGHPKVTAPAYAWVKELKREGDMLFAKFGDIDPQFEAGVKSRAYRNRSVNVFPDKQHGWRLRHVGWLGAVPPAIDGLADVEFAGDDSEALEFAAPGFSLVWGMEATAKLLRGMREQIVADKGIEAADAVLPIWRIDSVAESAASARTQFQEAEPGRMFSQNDNPGGSMTTFTQEQLDEAKRQAAKEGEDKAKLEFAAKEQQLITLQSERQTERIKAQLDAWQAKGLVTPAEAHGMAEFMAQLENEASVEFSFSAHDGKPAKKTVKDWFHEFMAARTPVVKLGGKSGAGDDAGPQVDLTSGRAIATAAHEFQAAQAKEGRVISVEDAIVHVTTRT